MRAVLTEGFTRSALGGVKELAAIAQVGEHLAIAVDAGRQAAQLTDKRAGGFGVQRAGLVDLLIKQVIEKER